VIARAAKATAGSARHWQKVPQAPGDETRHTYAEQNDAFGLWCSTRSTIAVSGQHPAGMLNYRQAPSKHGGSLVGAEEDRTEMGGIEEAVTALTGAVEAFGE
jgi:hypothetical protein